MRKGVQLNCHCILNFLKLLHMKKFLGVSWFTSSYSCLWGKTVDWQTKFSAVQFDHYPMLWLSLILNGIALYRLYMKSNLHTNLWHKLHRTSQLPLHTWLAILTPFCIQSEIDFTYNLQIFLFHMHILYTWELPGYAPQVWPLGQNTVAAINHSLTSTNADLFQQIFSFVQNLHVIKNYHFQWMSLVFKKIEPHFMAVCWLPRS